MSTESGWSSEKMFGSVRHKTLQSLGSTRIGEATAQLCLFNLPSGTQVILTITVVAMADPKDRKKLLLTFGAAHNARQWDIIRFLTGNLVGFEMEILSVPSATTLIVHNLRSNEAGAEILPAIGDTAEAMRWVTARGGVDGGFAVSLVGGATEAKQDDIITELQTLNTNNYLPIRSKGNIDFAVDNVTSLAWVELKDDVGATAIKKAQIFMSSGEPLEIGFGAAAAEVSQGYIIPGGNGFIDLEMPANTRVSVRAVNVVTVIEGILLVNFLG
jgi:hypothetical protein